MQTLIDIPEEDLTRLDKLSEDRQVPRDKLVRDAVSGYLAAQPDPMQDQPHPDDAIDKAFGLWRHRNEDGLAYQERLRSEWER